MQLYLEIDLYSLHSWVDPPFWTLNLLQVLLVENLSSKVADMIHAKEEISAIKVRGVSPKGAAK